jgi:DnaJ-class molecular chaperone
MIEKYLRLLGLNINAAKSDVKKLYRLLAKKNHPDKFNDPDEKIKQSKIMADITEAYDYILKNSEKICSREKSQIKQTPSDYRIYKLGLTYYNKYFDTFFKMSKKVKRIFHQTSERIS